MLHRSWITEHNVIARNPLGPRARRAGWQGCLLALDTIPSAAFVDVVREEVVCSESEVQSQWQMAQSITTLSLPKRGWLSLVLRVLDCLPTEFSLQDVYVYEGFFAQYYPKNRNVKAKIRQQLQLARDLGMISFVEPGSYRKCKQLQLSAR